jgi:hypothetical protein
MEKPFSGVSATGREELEVIGVRGQIFIKNIMFQGLPPLFSVAGFLRKSLSVRESRWCKKVPILRT